VSLVTTDWLEKNSKNVKILDATWHMPNSKKDALQEFFNNHIHGAQFFDLDKNSDEKNSIPHMLPSKEKWQETVSNYGISNEDIIVIYDNSDVISSCRCWYMFIYFGHNSKKVFVLDGGLKKWKLENKKTFDQLVSFSRANYLVEENKNLVKNKLQINQNIKENNFQLIDARGQKRFDGLEAEPREGLKSGHIQNSLNLPFSDCINKSDHTFKSKQELSKIFQNLKILSEENQVYTCGSGVTACILAMANKIINDKNPVIYDGSWSEYGLK
jgi:thiosulfate/3-mercaptopyruvate sulfurtransferase